MFGELRRLVSEVEGELAPRLRQALAEVEAEKAKIGEDVKAAVERARAEAASLAPEVKADAGKVATAVEQAFIAAVKAALASHGL